MSDPPSDAPATPAESPGSPTFWKVLIALGILAALGLAYVLRGVLVPLFLAFLLAYALDPWVDRLERLKVPRALGAALVMFGILASVATVLIFAVPMFIEELSQAASELPAQLQGLQTRAEPWLWKTVHVKVPHTIADLNKALGDRAQATIGGMLSTGAMAVFGTLGYLAVVLSALIVPVFALYLLIDFDRIVARLRQLIPRRWAEPVSDVATQIHKTLGGYVRGQITTNIVLAALYATGLRVVDIRLALPIGVLTGMLAFIPYIGFAIGLTLALAMSLLDWHGPGQVLAVGVVMVSVQILDGMVVTPRIVGRSVGLSPLEVLVTMMAAGTLFGFLGVLLAVPFGAVVKILVQRGVGAYLKSAFYARTTPGNKAA
jgi:predicted PurR-regulated permease PerM